MFGRYKYLPYLCTQKKQSNRNKGKKWNITILNRPNIGQQWRRKTLNRLNVKLHTCKGDLSKVEHYNKTLETNIKESNDKKRLMQSAPNKWLQSGFIIPYSHYKQQRNKTKTNWGKTKVLRCSTKTLSQIAREAVACLVVLLPV